MRYGALRVARLSMCLHSRVAGMAHCCAKVLVGDGTTVVWCANVSQEDFELSADFSDPFNCPACTAKKQSTIIQRYRAQVLETYRVQVLETQKHMRRRGEPCKGSTTSL